MNWISTKESLPALGKEVVFWLSPEEPDDSGEAWLKGYMQVLGGTLEFQVSHRPLTYPLDEVTHWAEITQP